MPIITSLSTRFFGHPRLTNPTFVFGFKASKSASTTGNRPFPPNLNYSMWHPNTDFVGDRREREGDAMLPLFSSGSNLSQQAAQACGVTGRSAKSRLRINLCEFAHRRREARLAHGAGKLQSGLRLFSRESSLGK